MLKFASKYCISIQKIRNFCIIAHIDHGKSTLADRMLEKTGTIIKGIAFPIISRLGEQYLDKLSVEKERGITIKAQSVSMYYKDYLFNLIDTPGHVDFTYEVSRAMKACQGALLLIDATQGIQAQTLSNFRMAQKQNLKIIPVINKIDMPAANIQAVTKQIKENLHFDENSIIAVSAKSGQNVNLLLDKIIDEFPHPILDLKSDLLKAFLVNSWYIKDRGVILLVQIKSGSVKKGDTIVSCATKQRYEVFEVGILNPEEVKTNELKVGQVGYLATNMKKASEARSGDTFKLIHTEIEPEAGFEPAKQLVFCGIYPEDPDEFNLLAAALQKLALTDPAVQIVKESSQALGNGYRCGFLGTLHMDVFRQRLEEEYDVSVIVTTPSVPYRAKLRSGEIIEIDNASLAPSNVEYYEEPIALATITTPEEYVSNIIKICQDKRGFLLDQKKIDDRIFLDYQMPLSEIVIDFFDKIKSLTRGYGTLEYDFYEYQVADIKKIVIHLMNEPISELSFMVHESKAYEIGKQICQRLKDNLPSQLFVISIQARIGNRTIAAEKVACYSKNVTAKCYGGDITRRKKLIERQKEGKKKLRMLGKVHIRKDTFKDILKS